MSAKITSIALSSIERRLARRYPGISCQVTRKTSDHYYGKGACLWTVDFFAKDREALINSGLATADQFEAYAALSYSGHSRHPSSHDGFGNEVTAYPAVREGGPCCVSTHIFDGSDNREYTKKLQMQVDRMLKPFIRGTWKPSPAVQS